MDNLRLKGDELKVYHRGLFRSHERRVELEVQTLEGDPIDRLTLEAQDGQIAVGRGGAEEVSRVLTLRAVDRKRALDFGPTSPGQGLYFDRMLQVRDSRYIPELGQWVTAFPFTGPIWSLDRQGHELQIVGHSKERLAMGTLWTPRTIHKGADKVRVIRDLLEDTGEDRFDLPNLDKRMPERKSLDRFASPWAHASKLGDSMNRQLLYPSGRRSPATLRRLPEKVSFTFREGDGGGVLTDPQVSRSLEGVANIVAAFGRKPKGKKDRPHAIARTPGNHDLSPWEHGLGRNGKPRYLVERVEDDQLRSNRECQQRADQILADRIRGLVDVGFDAGVVPHLDPGDICRLHLADGAVDFRLWDFSIPLGGGPMTVGTVRRTMAARRKGRA